MKRNGVNSEEVEKYVDYLVDVMDKTNTIAFKIEDEEVVFIKGDLAKFILENMGIIHNNFTNN